MNFFFGIPTNTKTKITSGAHTDSMGVFRFQNLPEGGPYSFAISRVGYKDEMLSGYTVKTGANISLLIKLVRIDNTLEEVVAVGYGVQKKINLTGSTDQVTAKQLESRPITNLATGLQASTTLRINYIRHQSQHLTKQFLPSSYQL